MLLAVAPGGSGSCCGGHELSSGLARVKVMNNLKLKILERVYAEPGLSIGGLADAISRGPGTVEEIGYLVEKGYLLDDRGLTLSKKGFACIDSASFRNRAKRVGKIVAGIAVSVVAVVIGNWLWGLIQSSL